jgi:uncharacterized phage protein (TIGR01671 family)
MDREIKFRAWDTKFKKMVDIEICHFISPITLQDYILMQYTGLKDVRNKEICEGDIVEIETHTTNPDFIPRKIVANVIFKDGAFYINTAKPTLLSRQIVKIKGNIFENADILKNK